MFHQEGTREISNMMLVANLWDDPYFYRICADGLPRRCVPMDEAIKFIERCHASPYGGYYGAYCTHVKI
jgi:hypothetical protein